LYVREYTIYSFKSRVSLCKKIYLYIKSIGIDTDL
jgi:hypothetical protein